MASTNRELLLGWLVDVLGTYMCVPSVRVRGTHVIATLLEALTRA